MNLTSQTTLMIQVSEPVRTMTYLNMSISWEVNGAERHIPEQAGAGTFVQSKQPQFFDHSQGSHFTTASNLTGDLKTNLHYF